MTLRRRPFVALPLSALLGHRAVAQARDPSTHTLRLGQSLPLSGSLAALGTAFRASAAATFGELASQSASTPRIELISLDDGGQPERTAVNAKLLASEHRVHAFFGFLGSGADRAGARGAAVEGVPYVAPVSGAIELRSTSAPGAFNFRARVC